MVHVKAIQPSPMLAPYVKRYLALQADKPDYNVQRTLPSGCIEVILYRQGGAVEYGGAPSRIPRTFLGGKLCSYIDLKPTGGKVSLISILFHPNGAKPFFPIPLNEAYNQLVSLDSISDTGWKDLADRITEATSVKQCIAYIESFLAARLCLNNTRHFNRIAASVSMAYNNPKADVTDLAKAACLGERQLNRVFSAYVGCNPKELIKVIRFNNALSNLQANNGCTAQTAAACCYSDQSHLIREFKHFSGYTPRGYLQSSIGFHYFP